MSADMPLVWPLVWPLVSIVDPIHPVSAGSYPDNLFNPEVLS